MGLWILQYLFALIATDRDHDEGTAFEYQLTSIKKPGKDWIDTTNKFYYADGTTIQPKNYEPPEGATPFPTWAIVVIVCICVPSICFVLLMTIVYKRTKVDDSTWIIPKSELKFSSPPHILGEGAFGIVLLAEYRGTQVAAKQAHLSTPEATTTQDAYGAVAVGQDATHPDRRVTVDLEKSTETSQKTDSHTSAGSMKSNPGKSRENFKMEMNHLSQLRHPCIVTLMGK